MSKYELGDIISFGKRDWFIVRIMEDCSEVMLLSKDIICKRNHDRIAEWVDNEGVKSVIKNKDSYELIERNYLGYKRRVFIPCRCVAYNLIPEIRKVPSKESWWADWGASASYSMTQQEYDKLREENNWGYGEGPSGIQYYTSWAVDEEGMDSVCKTSMELGIRPLVIISMKTAQKCAVKSTGYGQAMLELARKNEDPKNPDVTMRLMMDRGMRDYKVLLHS